ncbi:hypothetical protein ACFQUU_17615 [Herbaspirillum sp. GCM10030257]|uniref:hypothetical protein n=1 Tax=Herbaspirillum sp. GCM10030257 TaxID=3273393 RepID=UPI00362364AC
MAFIVERSVALWRCFLGRTPVPAEPLPHDFDGATGTAISDGTEERVHRMAPFPSGKPEDHESPPIFFL